MFLPSLQHMAEDFGVEYAVVNLAVAGYLLVTGVLQIILGPLSDRYGRRPVMLVAMALFAGASLGCWLAQDIWVFLGFRLLQAAVIGGTAISRAVVRDMVSDREAAAMLGQIGMVMALAPMLGPGFGGFLDEIFGWRANFAVFTLLGVALFILVWRDLGETNTAPSATFAAQFRAYPDLLRSRRFWGYALCVAFSVGAFYAFITGAAFVGKSAFGLGPAQVGIGIGSITGGFAFGNFLSGRLATRYGLTTMMILGRVVACCGLLVGLALVALDVVTVWTYFGSVMCVGLGNGLTLPSANAGTMSVRPAFGGECLGAGGGAHGCGRRGADDAHHQRSDGGERSLAASRDHAWLGASWVGSVALRAPDRPAGGGRLGRTPRLDRARPSCDPDAMTHTRLITTVYYPLST